ncbi:hypothetical protein DEI93_07120 [Curtobacterium sp. MCBD17_035]|uniref:hypothetical protein n=1 Tax=Curtobacterium sp. MCBD17_035 TaxID=2175673 RepID=UPI0015E8AA10|nr:hypothetical protein [Curtobacterium sp. MCBD17_035]WIB68792.1 hypothetical protein DEI93_07120 [Curtobacterium sp. MCBD17_035]
MRTYETVACHTCNRLLGIAEAGTEALDLEVQHLLWDCPEGTFRPDHPNYHRNTK